MSRPYAPLFRAVTTSEKLADLPNDTTRLFFDWLLTVVDDYGRATAKPRQLNALVWPLLGKSVKDTEKAVEALRAAGLIAVFPSDDGPFVQVLDHEDKSGSLGKRDHRKASHWPETAQLAQLGPEWPAMAHGVPVRPSRAGARPSCSPSESESSSPSESPLKSESDASAREAAPGRLVSDYWMGAFQRARGAPYLWQGGKDGSALARLVRAPGCNVAEIQRRIDRCLADEFWGPKADFAVFVSRWNQWAGQAPPSGPRNLIDEIMSAGNGRHQ